MVHGINFIYKIIDINTHKICFPPQPRLSTVKDGVADPEHRKQSFSTRKKNWMIVMSLPGGGSLPQSFCGVFSRDPTGRPRALIRLKCRKFNPTSFGDFCHVTIGLKHI